MLTSQSSGFWSGFFGSAFNPGTELGGKDTVEGFALRTTIAALVGGTASEVSGGKFANGALSAAFVHMFNAEWDTFMKSDDARSAEAHYNKATEKTTGSSVDHPGTKLVNSPFGRMLQGAQKGYSIGKAVGGLPGAIVGPGFGMIYKMDSDHRRNTINEK